MMQSMKGATQLLGSMNRQMNLPALQRIAMEFEKENDIMDQRQEMMDDAIDDVTGLEDEEEGEEVVQQVLDEIGIDLGQAVSRNDTASLLGGWLIFASSEKHHQDCRRMLSRKAVLLRLSAEEIPVMMISKRDLTAFGDDTIPFLCMFRWPMRTGIFSADMPSSYVDDDCGENGCWNSVVLTINSERASHTYGASAEGQPSTWFLA
jgi:hypothetical protein